MSGMNGNIQNRYSLPDGWEWSTLGASCDVILGQSPSSDTYNAEGIGLPFYQGKAEFGDLYPTPEKWCSSPKKIAEMGDILISVRAPVGPTNLAAERSCIGRGLAAIRPRGMPTKYSLYYLRYIEKEWDSKATGTTFKAITGDVLRNQEIPIAPLLEQQRIVSRIEELFSDLDAGMAALERVRAGLRRYKAAVLTAAVKGTLLDARGMEKADGGLLPGWRWTTTGELCDCIVPNRDKPKSFSGDTPWVTLPDFDDGIEIRRSKSGLGLSEEEIGKYRARVIPEGSVVMSCIGRFGITAVAARDIVVNQQLHAFLVPDDVLDAHYLAYAIRTQISYMEKIATATTIAYLNKNNCNSVPIPLPPLGEQRQIVAEIERRFSVVQEVEQAVDVGLARAVRLRQAVLKQAFQGRL
jgi:type I restriction enzyme, S subunit